MTRQIAEGRPVERRANDAAANEEFTRIVSRRDTLAREGGWDPYEVWLTRVKERRRKPREPGNTRDPGR
jgi:hypothetical protein